MKTITDKDLTSILRFMGANCWSEFRKRTAARNQCMTILGYYAGLRVSEMCKLTLNDVWAYSIVLPNLVVRSDIAKYGIERTIPLTIYVQESIRDYLAIINSDGLFASNWFIFYATAPFVMLHPRSYQRALKQASIAAIKQPVNPHMLRHSFATNALKRSNTAVVQKLLGHKHLSSTQVYTHPSDEDLRNAVG